MLLNRELIAYIAKLSTAVTVQVLRNIANAMDTPEVADPTSLPVVVHIAQLTINEAPPVRKLFGRTNKEEKGIA